MAQVAGPVPGGRWTTPQLRADLSDDEVADLVWSMNSVEYFGLLSARGWTPEAYAGLLRDVWARTLLA